MKTKYSLLLALLLVQLGAAAQDRDITIDEYYVDFAVPDITAFSILDINTNNVVRPGNVKEFAAGVLNYIDDNGNLKPGLAIEIAPYRLLAKSRKKSISAWRNSKSLKNLQLSIATAQGDSSNLLAAWGLNWTPIDKTDPVEDHGLQKSFANFLGAFDNTESADSLMAQKNRHKTEVMTLFSFLSVEQRLDITELFGGDYLDRLSQYGQDSISYVENLRNTVVGKLTKLQVTSDSAQNEKILALIEENAALTFAEESVEDNFTEQFAAEVRKRKQDFLKENWNRLVVQFKAGVKYNSEEGTINDFSILNYRIFGGIAGRVPGFGNGLAARSKFARNSQVVYQANYTSYRDGVSPVTWEFSTGGRLLYGKADKRFSGEFQYSKASVKGETNETLEYIRYTFGGEIKVTEGLWFELAVGGQKFLQGDEAARVVPEFGIKYAIQKKSRF